MKNFIHYVFSVSLSLLILMFLEGIVTMGMAFKFELYTIVGWIAQIMGIIFTVSLAIRITESEISEKQRRSKSF
jgi:hypothetical protein